MPERLTAKHRQTGPLGITLGTGALTNSQNCGFFPTQKNSIRELRQFFRGKRWLPAGMNSALSDSVITMFWVLALVPPAVLLLRLVVRDWCLEWGATDREVLTPMAGDEQVPEPNYQTTLAVTIAAEPADVWPWLVQMGYRRGGLYSYDWLDRLFGYLDRPSAEEILPSCQRLNVGDSIPVGRGPAFPVTVVEPFRVLVMGGAAEAFQWTWQFELQRVGTERTRLISRNRACVPRTAGSTVFMWVLEPAAFIMTRKMLLGIKRRAESLAKGRIRNLRLVA